MALRAVIVDDEELAELCEKMAAEVARFRGAAPAHDDLTVVVARAR